MIDTFTIFHPYQPSFMMDLDHYVEFIDRNLINDSVALFYQFKPRNAINNPVFVVPDGCIDIIFTCDNMKPSGNICGTVLKAKNVNFLPDIECFGVRLLPGNVSVLFNSPAINFVDKEIQIMDILKNDNGLIERIAKETQFHKRISLFTSYYLDIVSRSKDMPRLLHYVIRRINEENGQIKINELSDETGYTARYLHKVFQEYVGINPKSFCRVIRFQRSLNFIIKNNSTRISDLALELGYFDQAHFLHEFKDYCFLTPNQLMKRNICSEN